MNKNIQKIALLLVALLVLFAGCATGSRNKTMTTDTYSSSFTDHDEKMDFLKKYVVLFSPVEDAEYHIQYQDNSTGLIPGPSDWDMRVILKIALTDIPLWLDGFEEIPLETVDLGWWAGLSSETLSYEDLQGGAAYARTGDHGVAVVAYPDAGVVLKIIDSLPIQYVV